MREAASVTDESGDGIDLYIRDSDTDTGSQPSGTPHWTSPDIWVRNNAPPADPNDPNDPNHTFYFHVDASRVIDAKVGGNSSRWINHSCDPNCEAEEIDGRVFIKTLRAIAPGEELNYIYGLTLDERYTPALKKRFACHCGAAECRGTMLSPKR